MLGNILLVAIVIGLIVLLFLLLTLPGDERKLGERFNNVAWNIAIYGTDEAFREELRHWRWQRVWKQKLFDLRRRRMEIAAYWAAKKRLPA
jgi:hypothetical protein